MRWDTILRHPSALSTAVRRKAHNPCTFYRTLTKTAKLIRAILSAWLVYGSSIHATRGTRIVIITVVVKAPNFLFLLQKVALTLLVLPHPNYYLVAVYSEAGDISCPSTNLGVKKLGSRI